jgi:hypothetical protein
MQNKAPIQSSEITLNNLLIQKKLRQYEANNQFADNPFCLEFQAYNTFIYFNFRLLQHT